MKLTDNSNEPNRTFTESLIENALGKLEQLKIIATRDKKNITTKLNWWEKVMSLAAMFAIICLAGFGFIASQINSVFAMILLIVMFINHFLYIGGLIL